MIDPKYTKPVSTVVSTQHETTREVILTGSSIEYSLCDRTITTNNRGNYFVSFNLPTESGDFPTSGLTSIYFPELQQLNVDQIIITKIPNTGYTEYIDGRSFEITIPLLINSAFTAFTLYSSTYSSDLSLKDGETSPMLGDNIAYLFTDNINSPYTGYTTNEMGQIISHSAVTSWNPKSRLPQDRPSAVSYKEVRGTYSNVNSDRRLKRNVAVGVPCSYPEYIGHSTCFYDTYFNAGSTGLIVKKGHGFHVNDIITVDKNDKSLNPTYDGIWTISAITENVALSYIGNELYDIIYPAIPWGSTSTLESGAIFEGRGSFYNYDIPVGFAILDKGIIVLTHPTIVDNFYWTSGKYPDETNYTSGDKHQIHFSSATQSVKFYELDMAFNTSTVCMALNGEFYISNNRTWDRSIALSEFASNSPVHITEIGLYNALGELIGVGKFSEPIVREVDDIFTFQINMKM